LRGSTSSERRRATAEDDPVSADLEARGSEERWRHPGLPGPRPHLAPDALVLLSFVEVERERAVLAGVLVPQLVDHGDRA
jgi:hypothetical protein